MALTLGMLAAAGAARAADKAADTAIDVIDKQPADKNALFFDYGVPSSPALTLAGQSPDKISTSTALKPFVLQLPTAAGTSGQTVGLDVAPAWLLPLSSRTSVDYQDEQNRALRLAFRTHADLAVAQGIDNSDASKRQPSRLAFGFSSSLLDSSDPVMAPAPGTSGGSAWGQCLAMAKPQLDLAMASPDSPDQARISANTTYNAIVRQQDALKREQEALQKERVQIVADQAQLSADRQRFANVRSSSGAGTANQAAIDELVADKLKSIDDRTAPLKQRLADIDKRLGELVGDLDKVITDRTAANQQLGKITAADTTTRQKAFKGSEAAKLLPDCVDQANTAARYGPSWEVGGGALWNGTPGVYSHFQQSGYVAWTSYRHAIGAPALKDKNDPASIDSYWMAGLAARASWSEQVATDVKATPLTPADTVNVWLGLERLSATTRWSAQVGYEDRRALTPLTGFNRSRFRYFASVTQRVGPKDLGVWLQLGYGNVTETSSDEMVSLSVLFSTPAVGDILGLK